MQIFLRQSPKSQLLHSRHLQRGVLWGSGKKKKKKKVVVIGEDKQLHQLLRKPSCTGPPLVGALHYTCSRRPILLPSSTYLKGDCLWGTCRAQLQSCTQRTPGRDVSHLHPLTPSLQNLCCEVLPFYVPKWCAHSLPHERSPTCFTSIVKVDARGRGRKQTPRMPEELG